MDSVAHLLHCFNFFSFFVLLKGRASAAKLAMISSLSLEERRSKGGEAAAKLFEEEEGRREPQMRCVCSFICRFFWSRSSNSPPLAGSFAAAFVVVVVCSNQWLLVPPPPQNKPLTNQMSKCRRPKRERERPTSNSKEQSGSTDVVVRLNIGPVCVCPKSVPLLSARLRGRLRVCNQFFARSLSLSLAGEGGGDTQRSVASSKVEPPL